MSQSISQGGVRNRLLQALSERDFALLAPDLTHVQLPFGHVLERPGESIQSVVFLESGVASRLVIGADEELTETSHIGFEGMTAKPIVLGATRATNRIQMQIPGAGLALRPDRLMRAMDGSRELRLLMTRYALACELQAEHTLLAGTHRDIAQRLARWILMYHDRVQEDAFKVTHDLLGMMLNVRRSSITDALHILQGEHAIRSFRGVVQVVDREVLMRLAGGSYGIPEEIYEQLISPARPQ